MKIRSAVSENGCLIFFDGRKKQKKKQKLDGQGKARREAARRRNSECKINLSCRSSSRSNDSWRMSPKSTKYSAAAIGRRSDQ